MKKSKYIINNTLYSDSQYVAYKVTEVETHQSAILKTPIQSYPSAYTLHRLNKEFEILQEVSHPNVIKLLRKEPYKNSLALIFEDTQSISLRDFINNRGLPMEVFLHAACELAKGLSYIHRKKIIHKNLNTNTIWIDSTGKKIQIGGYSISTKVSREANQADPKELVDTQLKFISPEQTGRTNKPLDYRTDMYSIGMVLYTMLTGQPPIVVEDAMEIIHSHLALKPAEPHKIRLDAPNVLSQIVMRLLNKDPEDRYQSAFCLHRDLEKCKSMFYSKSGIESFPIAENDISEHFNIPEKLYGREKEVEELSRALQSAKTGNKELVLVSGYSGVGKSRLVSEVKKMTADTQTYFISGKFDQNKGKTPLSSILAALEDLIRQILTESDDRIERWQQKLKHELGPNGKVITDVIPQLEVLIGPQPEVSALPPIESANRFRRVFHNFVKTFVNPEQLLCLFLDDLQWIDSASRQWLESQINSGTLSHMMIIGAYRDNEVGPSHPLSVMIDQLKSTGVSLRELKLKPLDRETLNQLVADAMKSTPTACKPFSDLIYHKTNGNPFFTRQCLFTLYEKGAISLDAENGRWNYDLEKAQKIEISANVVDLMTEYIHQLSPVLQNLLKTAACIGNSFEISQLQILSGLKMENVLNHLARLVEIGMIAPLGGASDVDKKRYKFLHDRLQQAALSLLGRGEQKKLRLKIGRAMVSHLPPSPEEEKVYDMTDHLNFSKDLIPAEDPLAVELIRLNLYSSIRAKKAVAYEQSLMYVKTAMETTASFKLDLPPELKKSIYLQRAEAEHLCGNHDTAEKYYDSALDIATNPIERAKIYQPKIHFYTNLRKFDEAYQTGRKAVKELGINLPSKFVPPLFIKDLIHHKILLSGKKVSDLLDLKEMRDEKLKMALLLMATFARAAYQIKPELCVSMAAKMVNLSLQKGNTDGVYIGYMAFGAIFQGAILGQKKKGYEFGKLTLNLVEKYNGHAYKSEVLFVVGYFAIPWLESATVMEEYWKNAYQSGLETGDLFHASCACCGLIQSNFMRGVSFSEIEQLASRYHTFLEQIENTEALQTLRAVTQSIQNLKGKTMSPDSYDTDDFKEEDYREKLGSFSSRHFAHYYFINKMKSLYMWGEYPQAYEVAHQSDKYLKDSPGMLHTAEHYFYKGLIMCALHPNTKGFTRIKRAQKIKGIHSKFQKYAKNCADNFLHKSHLLQAEVHRIAGRNRLAEEHYNLSIDYAVEYGYTHIAALANYRAFSFQTDCGRHRLAKIHLKDAIYNFSQWGATGLVDQLVEAHSGLLSKGEVKSRSGFEEMGIDSTASSANRTEDLDLQTMLKSSEAISREIKLNDLVSAMLNIITENAGAERVVLILKKGNQMQVIAEGFVGDRKVQMLNNLKLDEYEKIPRSVINYVARTQKPIILDHASEKGDFTNDLYFKNNQTKSVLCTPLIQQGVLTGVVYLENNLSDTVFTQERIKLLILLSGQMAISLENAQLYENLEEKVEERTRELQHEKDKSDALLMNILPAETAEELKKTGSARAKEFDMATVLFTDFLNFTKISEKMPAQDLVNEINYYYSKFDEIIQQYGIEKIKTIGDSYMCAGGLPVKNLANPVDTVKVALAIRDFVGDEIEKRKKEGKTYFEIRIGLHTGPVIAGIVGIKKFAYDIWGDTVNIAARMESNGVPGKINISQATYEEVKDEFHCVHRGKMEAKNKGMIDMYFVEGYVKDVQ